MQQQCRQRLPFDVIFKSQNIRYFNIVDSIYRIGHRNKKEKKKIIGHTEKDKNIIGKEQTFKLFIPKIV